MQINPEEHRLALDNEPEIAQQVGILLSGFAILELTLPGILSKLSGMSFEDADITLGHFRSVGTRLDFIMSIAQTRTQNEEAKNIMAVIDAAKVCNSIRNRYVHSLWQQITEPDLKPVMKQISWLADATRNTSATLIDLTVAKKDCAKIRETLYMALQLSGVRIPEVALK